MKRKHKPAVEVIASLLNYTEPLSSLRLKLLVFLYDYHHSLDEGQTYTAIRYIKGVYGFLHVTTAKDFDEVLKDMLKDELIEEVENIKDDGIWKGYKLTDRGRRYARLDISRLKPYFDLKLSRLVDEVFNLTAEKEYGVTLV